MIGGLLQVIVGFAVSIILMVIGMMIYNAEKVRAIRDSGKQKKIVPVYIGYKDLSASTEYNTLYPADPNYRDLSPSINQRGGIEYSYTFWLYMDSTISAEFTGTNPSSIMTDEGLNISTTPMSPIVLLLRGDKMAQKYRGICSSDSTSTKYDVLVKNPMIRLDNKGDAISVEINTVNSPDAIKDGARNTCGESGNINSWNSLNSYRIGVKNILTDGTLLGKWFMVTVVVQDTYPTDPLPLRNKVRVQMYINQDMKVDTYLDGSMGALASSAPTVLRNSLAKLHVAPVIKAKIGTSEPALSMQPTSGKLRMADLTYYNYALTSADVTSIQSMSFNQKPAQDITNDTAASVTFDQATGDIPLTNL